MTAFVNKSFSVACSAPKQRLRPGTRAWERHVLCDSADCLKCATTAMLRLHLAAEDRIPGSPGQYRKRRHK